MLRSCCCNEDSAFWPLLLSRAGLKKNILAECFHDFMIRLEKSQFAEGNPIPENVLSVSKFSIDSSAFR